MKKIGMRALSLLLVVLMTVSLLPTSVLAAFVWDEEEPRAEVPVLEPEGPEGPEEVQPSARPLDEDVRPEVPVIDPDEPEDPADLLWDDLTVELTVTPGGAFTAVVRGGNHPYASSGNWAFAIIPALNAYNSNIPSVAGMVANGDLNEYLASRTLLSGVLVDNSGLPAGVITTIDTKNAFYFDASGEYEFSGVIPDYYTMLAGVQEVVPSFTAGTQIPMVAILVTQGGSEGLTYSDEVNMSAGGHIPDATYIIDLSGDLTSDNIVWTPFGVGDGGTATFTIANDGSIDVEAEIQNSNIQNGGGANMSALSTGNKTLKAQNANNHTIVLNYPSSAARTIILDIPYSYYGVANDPDTIVNLSARITIIVLKNTLGLSADPLRFTLTAGDTSPQTKTVTGLTVVGVDGGVFAPNWSDEGDEDTTGWTTVATTGVWDDDDGNVGTGYYDGYSLSAVGSYDSDEGFDAIRFSDGTMGTITITLTPEDTLAAGTYTGILTLEGCWDENGVTAGGDLEITVIITVNPSPAMSTIVYNLDDGTFAGTANSGGTTITHTGVPGAADTAPVEGADPTGQFTAPAGKVFVQWNAALGNEHDDGTFPSDGATDTYVAEWDNAPVTNVGVTVNLKKDGVPWTGSGKSVSLDDGTNPAISLTAEPGSTGVFTGTVPPASYTVLVDSVGVGTFDTSTDTEYNIKYWTVTLNAGTGATTPEVGGLASPQVVLDGTTGVTLSATISDSTKYKTPSKWSKTEGVDITPTPSSYPHSVNGNSVTLAEITAKTTYTVDFSYQTHTITYDVGGAKWASGTGGDAEITVAADRTDTATYNTDYAVKAGTIISRDSGWVFDGWVDGAGNVYKPGVAGTGNGKGSIDGTTITGDITLTAKWKLEVTFDVNNPGTGTVSTDKGSISSGTIKVQVDKGDVVGSAFDGVLPTLSEGTGRYSHRTQTVSSNTYGVWNRMANGLGAAWTAGSTVTEPVTLYAQWERNMSDATIIIQKEDGSGAANYIGFNGTVRLSKTANGTITSPISTTQDGTNKYEFTTSGDALEVGETYYVWATNTDNGLGEMPTGVSITVGQGAASNTANVPYYKLTVAADSNGSTAGAEVGLGAASAVTTSASSVVNYYLSGSKPYIVADASAGNYSFNGWTLTDVTGGTANQSAAQQITTKNAVGTVTANYSKTAFNATFTLSLDGAKPTVGSGQRITGVKLEDKSGTDVTATYVTSASGTNALVYTATNLPSSGSDYKWVVTTVSGDYEQTGVKDGTNDTASMALYSVSVTPSGTGWSAATVTTNGAAAGTTAVGLASSSFTLAVTPASGFTQKSDTAAWTESGSGGFGTVSSTGYSSLQTGSWPSGGVTLTPQFTWSVTIDTKYDPGTGAASHDGDTVVLKPTSGGDETGTTASGAGATFTGLDTSETYQVWINGYLVNDDGPVTVGTGAAGTTKEVTIYKLTAVTNPAVGTATVAGGTELYVPAGATSGAGTTSDNASVALAASDSTNWSFVATTVPTWKVSSGTAAGTLASTSATANAAAGTLTLDGTIAGDLVLEATMELNVTVNIKKDGTNANPGVDTAVVIGTTGKSYIFNSSTNTTTITFAAGDYNTSNTHTVTARGVNTPITNFKVDGSTTTIDVNYYTVKGTAKAQTNSRGSLVITASSANIVLDGSTVTSDTSTVSSDTTDGSEVSLVVLAGQNATWTATPLNSNYAVDHWDPAQSGSTQPASVTAASASGTTVNVYFTKDKVSTYLDINLNGNAVSSPLPSDVKEVKLDVTAPTASIGTYTAAYNTTAGHWEVSGLTGTGLAGTWKVKTADDEVHTVSLVNNESSQATMNLYSVTIVPAAGGTGHDGNDPLFDRANDVATAYFDSTSGITIIPHLAANYKVTSWLYKMGSAPAATDTTAVGGSVSGTTFTPDNLSAAYSGNGLFIQPVMGWSVTIDTKYDPGTGVASHDGDTVVLKPTSGAVRTGTTAGGNGVTFDDLEVGKTYNVWVNGYLAGGATAVQVKESSDLGGTKPVTVFKITADTKNAALGSGTVDGNNEIYVPAGAKSGTGTSDKASVALSATSSSNWKYVDSNVWTTANAGTGTITTSTGADSTGTSTGTVTLDGVSGDILMEANMDLTVTVNLKLDGNTTWAGGAAHDGKTVTIGTKSVAFASGTNTGTIVYGTGDYSAAAADVEIEKTGGTKVDTGADFTPDENAATSIDINFYSVTAKVTASATGAPDSKAHGDATVTADGGADETADGTITKKTDWNAATAVTTSDPIYVLSGKNVSWTATPDAPNYALKSWDNATVSDVAINSTGVSRTATFEKVAYDTYLQIRVNDVVVNAMGGDIASLQLVTTKSGNTVNTYTDTASGALQLTYDATKQAWKATGVSKTDVDAGVWTVTVADTWTTTAAMSTTDGGVVTVNLYSVDIKDGDYGNGTGNEAFLKKGSTTTYDQTRLVRTAGTAVDIDVNRKAGFTVGNWKSASDAAGATPTFGTWSTDAGNKPGDGGDSDDDTFTYTFPTSPSANVWDGGKGLYIQPVYTFEVPVDVKDSGNTLKDVGAANVVVKEDGKGTSDGADFTASDRGASGTGEYTIAGMDPTKTYELWINGFKVTEISNDEGSDNKFTTADAGTAASKAGSIPTVTVYKIDVAAKEIDGTTASGSANNKVNIGAAANPTGTEYFVPKGATTDAAKGPALHLKAAASASDGYRLANKTSYSADANNLWKAPDATLAVAGVDDATTTVDLNNVAADKTITGQFVKQFTITLDLMDNKKGAEANADRVKGTMEAGHPTGTNFDGTKFLYDLDGAGIDNKWSDKVDENSYVKFKVTTAVGKMLSHWILSDPDVEMYSDAGLTTRITENSGKWGNETNTTIYVKATKDVTVTAVFVSRTYDITVHVKKDNEPLTGLSGTTDLYLVKGGTHYPLVESSTTPGTYVASGIEPNQSGSTYQIHCNAGETGVTPTQTKSFSFTAAQAESDPDNVKFALYYYTIKVVTALNAASTGDAGWSTSSNDFKVDIDKTTATPANTTDSMIVWAEDSAVSRKIAATADNRSTSNPYFRFDRWTATAGTAAGAAAVSGLSNAADASTTFALDTETAMVANTNITASTPITLTATYQRQYAVTVSVAQGDISATAKADSDGSGSVDTSASETVTATTGNNKTTYVDAGKKVALSIGSSASGSYYFKEWTAAPGLAVVFPGAGSTKAAGYASSGDITPEADTAVTLYVWKDAALAEKEYNTAAAAYDIGAGRDTTAANIDGIDFDWAKNDAKFKSGGKYTVTVTKPGSAGTDTLTLGTDYTITDTASGKITLTDTYLCGLTASSNAYVLTVEYKLDTADDTDTHPNKVNTSKTGNFYIQYTQAKLTQVDIQVKENTTSAYAQLGQNLEYKTHLPAEVKEDDLLTFTWYYADSAPTQTTSYTASAPATTGWTAIGSNATVTDTAGNVANGNAALLTTGTALEGKYVFAVVQATVTGTGYAVTNSILVGFDAEITVKEDGTAVNDTEAAGYKVWLVPSTVAAADVTAANLGTPAWVTTNKAVEAEKVTGTAGKYTTTGTALQGDVTYYVYVTPVQGDSGFVQLKSGGYTGTAVSITAAAKTATVDYYTVTLTALNDLNKDADSNGLDDQANVILHAKDAAGASVGETGTDSVTFAATTADVPSVAANSGVLKGTDVVVKAEEESPSSGIGWTQDYAMLWRTDETTAGTLADKGSKVSSADAVTTGYTVSAIAHATEVTGRLEQNTYSVAGNIWTIGGTAAGAAILTAEPNLPTLTSNGHVFKGNVSDNGRHHGTVTFTVPKSGVGAISDPYTLAATPLASGPKTTIYGLYEYTDVSGFTFGANTAADDGTVIGAGLLAGDRIAAVTADTAAAFTIVLAASELQLQAQIDSGTAAFDTNNDNSARTVATSSSTNRYRSETWSKIYAYQDGAKSYTVTLTNTGNTKLDVTLNIAPSNSHSVALAGGVMKDSANGVVFKKWDGLNWVNMVAADVGTAFTLAAGAAMKYQITVPTGMNVNEVADYAFQFTSVETANTSITGPAVTNEIKLTLEQLKVTGLGVTGSDSAGWIPKGLTLKNSANEIYAVAAEVAPTVPNHDFTGINIAGATDPDVEYRWYAVPEGATNIGFDPANDRLTYEEGATPKTNSTPLGAADGVSNVGAVVNGMFKPGTSTAGMNIYLVAVGKAPNVTAYAITDPPSVKAPFGEGVYVRIKENTTPVTDANASNYTVVLIPDPAKVVDAKTNGKTVPLPVLMAHDAAQTDAGKWKLPGMVLVPGVDYAVYTNAVGGSISITTAIGSLTAADADASGNFTIVSACLQDSGVVINQSVLSSYGGSGVVDVIYHDLTVNNTEVDNTSGFNTMMTATFVTTHTDFFNTYGTGFNTPSTYDPLSSTLQKPAAAFAPPAGANIAVATTAVNKWVQKNTEIDLSYPNWVKDYSLAWTGTDADATYGKDTAPGSAVPAKVTVSAANAEIDTKLTLNLYTVTAYVMGTGSVNYVTLDGDGTGLKFTSTAADTPTGYINGTGGDTGVINASDTGEAVTFTVPGGSYTATGEPTTGTSLRGYHKPHNDTTLETSPVTVATTPGNTTGTYDFDVVVNSAGRKLKLSDNAKTRADADTADGSKQDWSAASNFSRTAVITSVGVDASGTQTITLPYNYDQKLITLTLTNTSDLTDRTEPDFDVTLSTNGLTTATWNDAGGSGNYVTLGAWTKEDIAYSDPDTTSKNVTLTIGEGLKEGSYSADIAFTFYYEDVDTNASARSATVTYQLTIVVEKTKFTEVHVQENGQTNELDYANKVVVPNDKVELHSYKTAPVDDWNGKHLAEGTDYVYRWYTGAANETASLTAWSYNTGTSSIDLTFDKTLTAVSGWLSADAGVYTVQTADEGKHLYLVIAAKDDTVNVTSAAISSPVKVGFKPVVKIAEDHVQVTSKTEGDKYTVKLLSNGALYGATYDATAQAFVCDSYLDPTEDCTVYVSAYKDQSITGVTVANVAATMQAWCTDLTAHTKPEVTVDYFTVNGIETKAYEYKTGTGEDFDTVAAGVQDQGPAPAFKWNSDPLASGTPVLKGQDVAAVFTNVGGGVGWTQDYTIDWVYHVDTVVSGSETTTPVYANAYTGSSPTLDTAGTTTGQSSADAVTTGQPSITVSDTVYVGGKLQQVTYAVTGNITGNGSVDVVTMTATINGATVVFSTQDNNTSAPGGSITDGNKIENTNNAKVGDAGDTIKFTVVKGVYTIDVYKGASTAVKSVQWNSETAVNGSQATMNSGVPTSPNQIHVVLEASQIKLKVSDGTTVDPATSVVIVDKKTVTAGSGEYKNVERDVDRYFSYIDKTKGNSATDAVTAYVLTLDNPGNTALDVSMELHWFADTSALTAAYFQTDANWGIGAGSYLSNAAYTHTLNSRDVVAVTGVIAAGTTVAAGATNVAGATVTLQTGAYPKDKGVYVFRFEGETGESGVPNPVVYYVLDLTIDQLPISAVTVDKNTAVAPDIGDKVYLKDYDNSLAVNNKNGFDYVTVKTDTGSGTSAASAVVSPALVDGADVKYQWVRAAYAPSVSDFEVNASGNLVLAASASGITLLTAGKVHTVTMADLGESLYLVAYAPNTAAAPLAVNAKSMAISDAIAAAAATQGIVWKDDFAAPNTTWTASAGFQQTVADALVFGYTGPSYTVRVENTGSTDITNFILSADSDAAANFTYDLSKVTVKKVSDNSEVANNVDVTGAYTLARGNYVEFPVTIQNGKGYSASNYSGKFTAAGDGLTATGATDGTDVVYEPAFQVNKAPIIRDKVAVGAIDAPTTGGTPDTTIPAANIYPDPTGASSVVNKTPTVVWTYNDGGVQTMDPANDKFVGGRVYTATVTFEPTDNYKFDADYIVDAGIDDTAVTTDKTVNTGYTIMGGKDSDANVTVTIDGNGRLVMTYTFPATAIELSIAGSSDGHRRTGKVDSATVTTDTAAKLYYVVVDTHTEGGTVTPFVPTNATDLLTKYFNFVDKANDGENVLKTGTMDLTANTAAAQTINDTMGDPLIDHDGSKHTIYAVAVPDSIAPTDATTFNAMKADAANMALVSNLASDDFITAYRVKVTIQSGYESQGTITAPGTGADTQTTPTDYTGEHVFYSAATETVGTTITFVLGGSATENFTTWTATEDTSADHKGTAYANGTFGDATLKSTTFLPKGNTVVTASFVNLPWLQFDNKSPNTWTMKPATQALTQSTYTVGDELLTDGIAINNGQKKLDGEAVMLVTYTTYDDNGTDTPVTADVIMTALKNAQNGDSTLLNAITSPYFNLGLTGRATNTTYQGAASNGTYVLDKTEWFDVHVMPGSLDGSATLTASNRLSVAAAGTVPDSKKVWLKPNNTVVDFSSLTDAATVGSELMGEYKAVLWVYDYAMMLDDNLGVATARQVDSRELTVYVTEGVKASSVAIKAMRTGTTDTSVSANMVGDTTTEATFGTTTVAAQTGVLYISTPGDVTLSTTEQDSPTTPPSLYFFVGWEDKETATDLTTDIGGTFDDAAILAPTYTPEPGKAATVIAYYDLLPTLAADQTYDVSSATIAAATRTFTYTKNDGSGNVEIQIVAKNGSTFQDGTTSKTLTIDAFDKVGGNDGSVTAIAAADIGKTGDYILKEDWIKDNLQLKSDLNDGEYVITFVDKTKTATNAGGDKVYDKSINVTVKSSTINFIAWTADHDPDATATEYWGKVKAEPQNSYTAPESKGTAGLTTGTVTAANIYALPEDGYEFVRWQSTEGTIGNAISADTTFIPSKPGAKVEAVFQVADFTVTGGGTPETPKPTQPSGPKHPASKDAVADASIFYGKTDFDGTADTLTITSTSSNSANQTFDIAIATKDELLNANILKNDEKMVNTIYTVTADTATKWIDFVDNQNTAGLAVGDTINFKVTAQAKGAHVLKDANGNDVTNEVVVYVKVTETNSGLTKYVPYTINVKTTPTQIFDPITGADYANGYTAGEDITSGKITNGMPVKLDYFAYTSVVNDDKTDTVVDDLDNNPATKNKGTDDPIVGVWSVAPAKFAGGDDPETPKNSGYTFTFTYEPGKGNEGEWDYAEATTTVYIGVYQPESGMTFADVITEEQVAAATVTKEFDEKFHNYENVVYYLDSIPASYDVHLRNPGVNLYDVKLWEAANTAERRDKKDPTPINPYVFAGAQGALLAEGEDAADNREKLGSQTNPTEIGQLSSTNPENPQENDYVFQADLSGIKYAGRYEMKVKASGYSDRNHGAADAPDVEAEYTLTIIILPRPMTIVTVTELSDPIPGTIPDTTVRVEGSLFKDPTEEGSLLIRKTDTTPDATDWLDENGLNPLAKEPEVTWTADGQLVDTFQEDTSYRVKIVLEPDPNYTFVYEKEDEDGTPNPNYVDYPTNPVYDPTTGNIVPAVEDDGSTLPSAEGDYRVKDENNTEEGYEGVPMDVNPKDDSVAKEDMVAILELEEDNEGAGLMFDDLCATESKKILGPLPDVVRTIRVTKGGKGGKVLVYLGAYYDDVENKLIVTSTSTTNVEGMEPDSWYTLTPVVGAYDFGDGGILPKCTIRDVESGKIVIDQDKKVFWEVDLSQLDTSSTSNRYTLRLDAVGRRNVEFRGSFTTTASYTLNIIIMPPPVYRDPEPECPCKVFFYLGLTGTTPDDTIMDVEIGDMPTSVPEVTAIEGYKFLGWSLTDPRTLKEGEVAELVDPTTVTIEEDTTFYAVYEKLPEEVEIKTQFHKHYVIGYPNGKFGPEDYINRASVATIIARAILPGFVEGKNYGNPGNYPDVEGHWAASAIAYCTRYGVFKGYNDGTFAPDNYITRQEFALVMARICATGVLTLEGDDPFTDFADAADWAKDGIYTTKVNGLVDGYLDGTFKPLNNIRRDEAVKIFNRFLGRGVDGDGLSDLTERVYELGAPIDPEKYSVWTDVPQTQWAYYEIIEAANDHEFYYTGENYDSLPEHWVQCALAPANAEEVTAGAMVLMSQGFRMWLGQ